MYSVLTKAQKLLLDIQASFPGIQCQSTLFPPACHSLKTDNSGSGSGLSGWRRMPPQQLQLEVAMTFSHRTEQPHIINWPAKRLDCRLVDEMTGEASRSTNERPVSHSSSLPSNQKEKDAATLQLLKSCYTSSFPPVLCSPRIWPTPRLEGGAVEQLDVDLGALGNHIRVVTRRQPLRNHVHH